MALSGFPSSFPSYRFSVAPMIGWTNHWCRRLHRLFTQNALLYTEMIPIQAFLRGALRECTTLSPQEGPVALQLGGSDPKQLEKCASLAERLGYVEINLNVGCPSTKVKAGNFGAMLFQTPKKVAQCMQAMREHCSLPLSVKTRLGVDEWDRWEDILHFIETVYDVSGCDYFIFHARKAWLSGLNPKENRTVPPLKPEWIYRLKQDFPQLTIIYNGGVKDLTDVEEKLNVLDGVMIGRAAYEQPDILREVDARIFQKNTAFPETKDLIDAASRCLSEALDDGHSTASVGRHLMGLFRGTPGAGIWRRSLGAAILLPKNYEAFWQAYETYLQFPNLKNIG